VRRLPYGLNLFPASAADYFSADQESLLDV
jgi:hypothetical protein